MTKKLSDKLGDVFVTTNPQSSGLAGETIYYSGDTSGWEVIGGVTQQDGWALCDGAEVTQAEYPDLFEAIGTAWNFGGETGFRLPTIPDVAGTGNNAVAIVALYNNVASVVSTRDLSVNKLSIDEDLTVGTTAVIPDLTVNGTLTADAVVSNSGETVSDILGEVKSSVLTEAQFQSLKGTGWVLAHGQAVDRTVYADLYALIGDTYGAGDGSTTFNLPDLRERYIRGASGEGMTSNDLGASNNDTTRVDNVAVVADSSIKSFSDGQTNTSVGAQGINANINSTNLNIGGGVNASTNNDGSHDHGSGNFHFQIKGVRSNNTNNIASTTFLSNTGNGLNTRTNFIGVSATANGAAFAFPSNANTPNLSNNFTNINNSNGYVDVIGNSLTEGSHSHNVNIDHQHGIGVNNVNNHDHTGISGNVDINHGHNLTGDIETAPKSVVLNYFIKIA